MNKIKNSAISENKLDKKKVILGLSGGVDSTAAALLLQEKGYEVIGLYFDVRADEGENNLERKYAAEADTADMPESLTGRMRAEIAAQQLGIRFIYTNVSSEFSNIVIENFCSEYIKGRTPNPCIVCNPAVKFKTLIKAADEEGAYYIATGHYADTYFEPNTSNDMRATKPCDIDSDNMGTWYIKRAVSEKKDQSYMLYRLDQVTISRLMLPLNEVEDKEKVRQLTREHALKNADAKDSQEICFIDDDDNYKDFLNRRGFDLPKGDFVDKDGNVLGEHQGILNYTIGQRKGLGIALGKPAFVTEIDSNNNRVVLGENEDLFTTEVISDSNILMGFDIGAMKEHAASAEGDTPTLSIGFIGLEHDITAKIRYAAKPTKATIQMLEDGKILTTFKEPQRAVTPGQSIVFYQGDLVIGGGFIE